KLNTMTFVAPNVAEGEERGGRIPHSGSVTDEQRSHRPNWAQPSGRQFFSSRLRCSLLTDPRRDMLVARASSGRKIPCRERHRIYASDHLGKTSKMSCWFTPIRVRCRHVTNEKNMDLCPGGFVLPPWAVWNL